MFGKEEDTCRGMKFKVEGVYLCLFTGQQQSCPEFFKIKHLFTLEKHFEEQECDEFTS